MVHCSTVAAMWLISDFLADGCYGGGDNICILMQNAHFDALLAVTFHPPSYALHQGWTGDDGFAVVGLIVKPAIQVPPVVYQGDEAGLDPAGAYFLGHKA
jgi:hypothetical protein